MSEISADLDYPVNDDQALINTAKSIVAAGKGLLAMDESNPTCNKRFAQFGIPQTPEMRRQYRELLVTTPGLNNYISAAILYDETVRQQTSDGKSFIDVLSNAGIIPGIKVDTGTTDMAGFPMEKVTEGLDGLRDRLKEYAGIGLRFAKWRAVISIGEEIPTDACISANMQSLARYAALCQEQGVMPIVEPEVLMEGTHSLLQCAVVVERVLNSLFGELYKNRVMLEGLILKPNMILPGKAASKQNSLSEVADSTIKCFLKCVPAVVPGIAFLSGGQADESASARLNEMNMRFRGQLPWTLTFSFSRALQSHALELWDGKDENIIAAQQALLFRAKCNSAASLGEYSALVERH